MNIFRKLIGAFLIFLIILIFSIFNQFSTNISKPIFDEFGMVGIFIFYIVIGGLFISIIKWIFKWSWKKITVQEKQSFRDIETIEETKKEKINIDIPEVSSDDIDEISINEDKWYEQALMEIDNNNTSPALWARSLAKSDGDINKTKSLYIQYRVKNLMENENTEISVVSSKNEESEWDKKYSKLQQEVKEKNRKIQQSKKDIEREERLIDILDRKAHISTIKKTYTKMDIFFYPDNYTEKEKKKILGEDYEEN